MQYKLHVYIDGLMQDHSISTANAMQIPQSCIWPSMYASLQNMTV